MWRNPRYPAPEAPARDDRQGPPEDRGERLATLPRGQGEELRVSLDEYEGRPYISLRVWAIGQDGSWWPTKKGCSVRIREITDVAQALMRANDMIFGPRCPSPPALPAARGYRRPEGPAPRELPGLAGGGEDFDEFR